MKMKKFFAFAIAGMLSVGAWAQTDVTSTYLTNADFSSASGWTSVTGGGSEHSEGQGLIGTLNLNSRISTADESHLTTEYCYGFSARWNGRYTYIHQTSKSELIPGVYTLSYDIQDVNSTSTKYSIDNYFYVMVGETKYTDSKTEWMNGGASGWTTHTISFTLEEASSITVYMGYGNKENKGSSDCPAIYVSHVNLSYQSLLDGVKALWQDAKDAAELAIASDDYVNVTGTEKTALQTEIDKAEPTTQGGYEEATTALNNATTAFTSAKDSYDAFAAAKAAETPELAYAAAAKKTALTDAKAATATSAEDAVTKTAAITTALRAYYESHALAEGKEGAVNVTSKLTNPSEPENTSGWTTTKSSGDPKIRIMNGEPWTNADGNATHSYFDSNSWGSAFDATFTQDVTLDAGKYLLTAKARGNSTTENYQVIANGLNTAITTIGNNGGVFNRGWNDFSVEFEVETTGSVTLGARVATTNNTNWLSFGDFRLVRLELYATMADATDYANLNAAIEAAEAKTIGFDAGEYAPYNNIAALTALAAAKAVDQSVENGQEDIQALTTALSTWAANDAEVNAIYDGVFANTEANTTSGNITLPGWTKVDGIRLLVKDETTDPGLAYTDGKAAVFSWGGTTLTYGNQAGYTLPLNTHEIYELTFKISGWRDGDLPSWVGISLDGKDQSVTPTGIGRINAAEDNPFVTLKFFVTPTEENSVLTISGNKHFAVADLNMKKAVAENITLNESENYVPAETYANVTLQRTIKKGFNTVVLPFDLDADQVAEVFGEGTKVYAYTEESTEANDVTINFNSKAENTIEANVPVLVKATAEDASEKVINGVLISAAGVQNVEGNYFDFVGTYAANTEIAEGDCYLKGDQIFKSNGTATIAGFRAYVKNNGNGEAPLVKSMYIDGLATDIRAINGAVKAENGVIFNLAGQRMMKAQKGIMIMNGKKVVIK